MYQARYSDLSGRVSSYHPDDLIEKVIRNETFTVPVWDLLWKKRRRANQQMNPNKKHGELKVKRAGSDHVTLFAALKPGS